MAYKHQVLLAENRVDASTLPPSAQNMIAQFAEQEYDLEAEENDEANTPADIRALRTELKKLDNSLYRLVKDFIDHEASEELTGAELKSVILSDFYHNGQHKVSLSALKLAGYPLSNKVRINESAGPYRLVKRRYDNFCTILPLN